MMTVLKIIIAVFVIMCVAGLLKGKGRSKANSREMAREEKHIESYAEKIERYENDPEASGITEDEYMLACYFTEKPYKGYDLKKAVAFHTTCELRGITGVDSMKNILSYDEIYGDISKKDVDVLELNRLGERVSNLTADLKRIERA